MRGRFVHKTWAHDPWIDAPARYRRACAYDAFIPDTLADVTLELPGAVAGVISDAENAIADLTLPLVPNSHRSHGCC